MDIMKHDYHHQGNSFWQSLRQKPQRQPHHTTSLRGRWCHIFGGSQSFLTSQLKMSSRILCYIEKQYLQQKKSSRCVKFGDWTRNDIQYCSFQDCDLTYAHFVRLPTWGWIQHLSTDLENIFNYQSQKNETFCPIKLLTNIESCPSHQ